MPSIAIALPILVITYVLVMIDRFDRSVIALLGGGAMILTGVLTQNQAVAGIDFNTIGLLTGMMLLVSIARRSGVFAFLFAEVLASNFGGTATLIGDPPNILIGSAADLDFNVFLVHVAPVVVVVLAMQVLVLHLQWRGRLSATAEARAAVLDQRARDRITDPRLLRHAALVFALVLLGFVTARQTGLEVGTIALIGGAALMLLENLVHHREQQTGNVSATYGEVDWITIFFFVGLFIVVRGVESTGAFAWLAQTLVGATHGNLGLTASVVLWTSAVLSAVVDNIPFVAAMIPVIHALAPGLGGNEAILPLWVALSLGACFGGNGTLVGASANLTVAGIAQREGVPFGFVTYTRQALPLTLASVAIAQAYLWLRYF
jgi:Na+/H+ antiporter NhaD/arsenite permease-like protein